MRGFREYREQGLADSDQMTLGVSIPRRVLRGFRAVPQRSRDTTSCLRGFNTPEGVEGFSRGCAAVSYVSNPYAVSIPRRVLRGFRAAAAMERVFRVNYGVSIPRRVLRGFRGVSQARWRAQDLVSIPRRVLRGFRAWPAYASAGRMAHRFNTPEGVEGFSSSRSPRGLSWSSISSFNTPEGVEGFSSGTTAATNAALKAAGFQYPGGC